MLDDVIRKLWMFYDVEGAAGGGSSGSASTGPTSGGASTGSASITSWDAFLESQADEVKLLYSEHVNGLKSALKSERESRSALEKQLRELAGKAEKGSESEKQLMEMADRLSESDRKADFYESAHAAGVSNLKLAWMIAKADDLFDRNGNVDFEKMKASYPEIFGGGRLQQAKGNAGSGTNIGSGAGKTSMDDLLRGR